MRRHLLGSAAALTAYLVLAVLAFWHVWSGHPTSDMQLGGDQWRNVWFLAWVPFAIGHGLDPFFSGYANVPGGVNLLAGAGIPVIGFVFAPVTLLWGPVATFNVVSTVALAASAGAGFFLIRRFTAWVPAAFIGGLLYGFSPALVAQAMDGHVNLSFGLLPPVILLLLHDLLVTRRGRPVLRGVVLGVVIAAQFLVSSEILFDTAVVAVVAVVVTVIVGHGGVGGQLRQATAGLASGAVAAVVLLAWPVWFLLRGPAHVSGKLQLVPQAYRSNLEGAVIPDTNQLLRVGSLLSRADHFSNTPGENGAYLGVVLLAVLLVAIVVLRRNRVVQVATVTGLVAFVLSLGGALAVSRAPRIDLSGQAAGSIPLPERLFSHLPLLDNVVPGRYGILVALFAAVILAMFIEHLHARLAGHLPSAGRHRARSSSSSGASIVLPALLAAAALVPLIPSVPFEAIGPTGTPTAYTSTALDSIPSGGVALVFPYPSNAYPQPSLWQAEAHFRFRMPGGYFLVPQGPARHLAFSAALGYACDSPTGESLTSLAQGQVQPETPAVRAVIDAQLRSWRVSDVIASPAEATDPAQALAFLRWLLGPPTAPLPGGSYLWTSVA